MDRLRSMAKGLDQFSLLEMVLVLEMTEQQ
jgi:hypothetical protein